MVNRNDSNGAESLESVNVRIPDELLSIVDGLVEKGVFSSRAEAIREFLREYAIESRTTPLSGRKGGVR